MSNRQVSDIARIFIEARQFLEDHRHWCPEGLGAAGVFGRRRCLLRALYDRCAATTTGFYERQVQRIVIDVCAKHFNRFPVAVNAMGHAAVLKALDLCIEESMRETANADSNS